MNYDPEIAALNGKLMRRPAISNLFNLKYMRLTKLSLQIPCLDLISCMDYSATAVRNSTTIEQIELKMEREET